MQTEQRSATCYFQKFLEFNMWQTRKYEQNHRCEYKSIPCQGRLVECNEFAE